MRVKIEATLEVNERGWAEEFGVAAEDVREDVKTYFAVTCEDQLRILGLQAVTVDV